MSIFILSKVFPSIEGETWDDWMLRPALALAFSCVCVVRLFGTGFMGGLKQLAPLSSSFRETASSQLTIMFSGLAAIASLLAYFFRPHWIDRRIILFRFLRIGGVFFVFVAAVLLHCTHVAMGKAWNPFITILPDQHLVMSFPFNTVRHPMYLSVFLMCLGAGLTTRSVIVLSTWGLFCAASVARIPVEESVLVGHFGNDYVQFQAAVPSRLIPCVW